MLGIAKRWCQTSPEYLNLPKPANLQKKTENSLLATTEPWAPLVGAYSFF